MCGITGIFETREPRPIRRDVLARMNESQAHRGPDGHGFHVEPGLGLGHRRLSIIDVATGKQPLYNEDGSVVVVFNGEIYNYQTLMVELIALGHTFRTRSDTECIVHAWESWGPRCVERFRGMFAFALWDRIKETLFLARDRLGVKPLHYCLLPDGKLIFGSELKSLTAHGGFSRALDPRAVEDYFALGYVPDPRTIYEGVHKLPPGHTFTMRRGTPLPPPQQYWDVDFTLDNPIALPEAQLELVDRLQESVRLRMISEVPLGAFLSGGVDSSSVVAMMAGESDTPVKTCAIAFSDPAFDESTYAQVVAERFATAHHVERVESDDFGLIDQLAQVYDEPYADSSALPTYRVCQLARKHVTVALSGDGGDESFAGYRRYRLHLAEERLRRALKPEVRRPIFGFLGRAYPKADWAPRIFRAKSTFEALARDSVEAYFNSVSILRDPMRRDLFSRGFRTRLDGYHAYETFRAHADRGPRGDALAMVQYLDLKTYLPCDINTKVDRASMAHSLEVREPLMDHKLVEWLAGLPSSLKLRGGEGKFLLKQAMRAYLPDEILYRPKQGFAVPLARWFRGPLKRRIGDIVLGDRLAETGIFNARYLRHLVDAHGSGKRDYSAPLWTLMMFDAFLRNQQSTPSPALRERATA